jgi:hypothetical protein
MGSFSADFRFAPQLKIKSKLKQRKAACLTFVQKNVGEIDNWNEFSPKVYFLWFLCKGRIVLGNSKETI